MGDIIVEQPSQAKLEALGVFGWPIWEKEVLSFPWTYDLTEMCYILEGEVIVTPKRGKPVSFGVGDFVTFPAGVSCKWEILKDVKKHYYFEG